MERFADVIIAIPHSRLDRPFTYRIPGRLTERVVVGTRVKVPFRQRQEVGYVIGVTETAEIDRPREILACLDEDPVFDTVSLELAEWMANQYACSLLQAIECQFPAALKHKGRKVIGPAGLESGEIVDAIALLETLDPPAARVLGWLWEHGETDRAELGRRLRIRDLDEVLASLQERHLIEVDTFYPAFTEAAAGQDGDEPEKQHAPLVLNPDQARAVLQIRQALERKKHQVFLLHGITGSGKTEVYLHSIAFLLEQGLGAIVLVPEIALTPQTVARFRSRFGNLVAVLHSRQSSGVRLGEWQRIRGGQARVVIGPRSAVFAPLPRPGLIIVDEEHEVSYKQEQNPRYHAREVAIKRAALLGIPVVLGSATPALETYYQAVRGDYRLLELPSRVESRPLPDVTIIDLRQEIKAGNTGVLSENLKEKIAARLERGEQTILFLNRRGFTTFVICRDCGYVLKCPNCAISLTYHYQGDQLRCHYCGYSTQLPRKCSRCGSSRIRHFGTGTQKVEDEVRNLFPQARVLRLDMDTTGKKGVLESTLAAFAGGEADILVGTQMVAKGLDFPNVTLVGVITADTVLNLPDFRAAERTFQLLTQVAGRAGRGNLAGEVVIQTYHPDRYPVVLASSHDYKQFWQQESEFRRRLEYPPYSHLARLLVVGPVERNVIREASDLARELNSSQGHNPAVQVLGPAPAALNRLKNRYRWHIVLKAVEIQPLLTVVDQVRREYSGSSALQIDVNPLGML